MLDVSFINHQRSALIPPVVCATFWETLVWAKDDKNLELKNGYLETIGKILEHLGCHYCFIFLCSTVLSHATLYITGTQIFNHIIVRS